MLLKMLDIQLEPRYSNYLFPISTGLRGSLIGEFPSMRKLEVLSSGIEDQLEILSMVIIHLRWNGLWELNSTDLKLDFKLKVFC